MRFDDDNGDVDDDDDYDDDDDEDADDDGKTCRRHARDPWGQETLPRRQEAGTR